MFDFNFSDFIYRNFPEHGYTWVNTLTYGIVLAIGVFFVIKLIKKLGIKIDKKFFIAISPFILYGSTMRALVDGNFYPDIFFFVAPGIYFTIFFICVASLILGMLFFKEKFHKFVFAVGALLSAFNLSIIIQHIVNWYAFIAAGIFLIFVLIIFLIIKFYGKKLKFLTYEKNYVILLAHLFDASATFTGIAFFNYAEKHVLPNLLIDISSPAVMFPLKLVVLPVLYFIDQIEDDTSRRLIKITIFILGISPGIRDFTIILMGV